MKEKQICKDVVIDIEKLENLPLPKMSQRKKRTPERVEEPSIENYIENINKLIDELTRKRHELEEEKELLERRIDEIDGQYVVQLDKLRDKNEELNERYISVCEENIQVRIELRDVKQELANLQYSDDILQVDYQNERNINQNLKSQLRESQKRIKTLQTEINESDKASTKRHNRLVEKLDDLQEENHIIEYRVAEYEKDIESLNLMCFVCRAGVKMCACNVCNKKICRNCYDTLDACPFCRQMKQSLESENLT